MLGVTDVSQLELSKVEGGGGVCVLEECCLRNESTLTIGLTIKFVTCIVRTINNTIATKSSIDARPIFTSEHIQKTSFANFILTFQLPIGLNRSE